MKKTLLCTAILALAGIGFWLWFTWPQRQHHLGGPVEVPPNVRWLEVGLSHRDQDLWHHISEGSEMLPLSFLEALKCPRTGRSFLESLAEYGFLIESPDPHQLPVGWTTAWHDLGSQKVPFVGINCAACHSGEIRYGHATLRMDGAPNLFSLEQFFVDLRDALTALRNSPLEAFLFVRNVIRSHHNPQKAGEFLEVSPAALHLLDSVNTADGLDAEEAHLSEFVGAAFGQIIDERTEATNLEFSYSGFAGGTADAKRQTAAAPPAGQSGRASTVREIVSALHAYEHELERRMATVRILADAIDAGTDLGPGRGDSFGIIRDLLFPFDPVTLEAPVSTPDLFDFRDFKFIHWDGNTTSVMDRNIAQAVALGADFDKTTFKSTVQPRNLHRLETIALKIHPPKWPEDVLGNIDRAKAARGQAHYQRLCHECHQSENIYPAEKVGTSPLRATNLGQTVANLPFPQQLAAFASQAKFVCCKDQGITAEEAKQMERTDNPVWRSTGGYIARPLSGTWATAPFLHNGSVPTLYDLLQPQARRPTRFPVGHRDYDPRKVGFTTDIKSPIWMFDTQLKGNANSGHEYGAGLSEDEKWELIEYLKTL